MDNHQAGALGPSRPDLATAKIVDAGIALQTLHGSAYAADYLSKNGVAFSVSVRVLSEPFRRRRSDHIVTAINTTR